MEFATSAHSSLLFDGGLLTEQTRILGSHLFPAGGREDLVEGLVIDDFYAISCPELSAPGPPEATRALQTSQKIYDKAGLLGSREKDVIDSDRACCAGAEIDGSARTRGLGLALVGPPVARLLWRAHHVPSEGARLLSRHRAVLRRVDQLYEETAETKVPGPRRPPALRFHFLQIGARQSELCKLLSADGLRVGPWLDLSCSPEYDWARPRVVEWVFHLVENGLVDSILVGPPSGAFGFGGRSRRTLATPWGAKPRSPRTRLSNRLACHALALLQLCARCRLPCSVFHPASSALPFTPQWRSCVVSLGCRQGCFALAVTLVGPFFPLA